MLADFELHERVGFLETKPIGQFVTEKFLNREVDKVSVLYTPFRQHDQPAAHRPDAFADYGLQGAAQFAQRRTRMTSGDPIVGYKFEPSAEKVLDVMLPYYIQYQVYQMVLDARASEHSARMVAMKNATDNAKEFIKDLTLEYNKMRQASITTELLEIATAQMALGS